MFSQPADFTGILCTYCLFTGTVDRQRPAFVNDFILLENYQMNTSIFRLQDG